MTIGNVPRDLEAERILLATVLFDERALDKATGLVSRSDFYGATYAKVWGIMEDLASTDTPVNQATISHALGFKDTKGQEALLDIAEGIPQTRNTETFAARIRDVAQLRTTYTALAEQAAECLTAAALRSPAEQIAAVDTAIFAATNCAKSDETAFTIQESFAQFVREAQEAQTSGQGMSGTSTGLAGLDSMLDGFRPGEMIVLAGRPGSGKSALLKVFALAHARLNLPVLVMSLEMQAVELTKRFVTELSGVDVRRFYTPDGKREWPKIAAVGQEIHGWPITMDQKPAATVAELRSRCRQVKAHYGSLGLVVIDYLQLMKSGEKTGSREQEVGTISKAVKTLAKELNVPIVALAQLNRGVENRADKRPMLSDLRESGSIEQDADAVIFIHRDTDSEDAELIIGKQRSGQTGSIQVRYDRAQTRFYEGKAPYESQSYRESGTYDPRDYQDD